MLSGFGIGIRLALSEYPGVKWLLCRKQAQSDRLLRRVDDLLDKQIDRDADKLLALVHRQLVVIDDHRILHCQDRHAYVHWEREIYPRVGHRYISLCICGASGMLRNAVTYDLSFQWCPKCWPGIQQTIDKYRL